MVQASIFITGDVIGVGFRSFVKFHARRLELSGWVKNTHFPNRGVKARFEGEKEKIDKIIAICRKGPDNSWVEKVEVKWLESAAEFTDFTVTH